MNNIQRIITRVLMVVVISSSMALAHGGEDHVLGVISKVEGNKVTVHTKAGKDVQVTLDKDTVITQGDSAAKAEDLKAGERVVIHAKKGSDGSLVAHTVKFSASGAESAASGGGHQH
jgi:Domain of unknown function (DUF5666)